MWQFGMVVAARDNSIELVSAVARESSLAGRG